MSDMFNKMSGFGIFDGFAPVLSEGEKKKPKNSKSIPKEEPKFAAPMRVVFDSLAPVDISGTESFTKTSLMEKITELTGISCFAEYSKDFILTSLKKDVYRIIPSDSCKVKKGTDGKFLLLEKQMEIVSFMEGDVSVENIINYIHDHYHMDVYLYLVGDTYIPIPYDKKHGILKNLHFPINIYTLLVSENQLEITEEDYKNFSAAISDSEGLKENSKPMDTNSGGYPILYTEVMKRLLQTLFPNFCDDLKFAIDEEQNCMQIMFKEHTKKPSSGKTETTYPADATISLVFTRIPLSPDVFNGKKEVTAKEVIKYLGKQYPEYSVERTELYYDKKKNLIIPNLKSGKRGADQAYTYELIDTIEKRKERSPIMTVIAYKGVKSCYGCVAGAFKYHLPKIPFDILKRIIYFFWDVYVFQKTEALAQIFFSIEKKEYIIYIPEQICMNDSVEFLRNNEMEQDSSLYLVMEIHSHGFYPAVWSVADNQDELAHRLYAVVGDLSQFKFDSEHIRIRAATGGFHVIINPSDVFMFPETLEEYNPDLKKVRNTQL